MDKNGTGSDSLISVKLAGHMGYCFGVKRAVEMVEKALETGPYPVWTLGPLIHNPTVITDLESRGVKVATELEEVSGGTLVLRTHGTTLEEHSRIPATVEVILDATCPFVSRTQKLAEKYWAQGKIVLVLGDKDHPEVRSILSHTRGNAMCVRNPEELLNILDKQEFPKDVAVLAQTTSRISDFQTILNLLDEAGIFVESANTICTATDERQKSMLDLTRECNLIIVVGGRTSANTTQLLNIAKEGGYQAYLVESVEDVLPQWFDGELTVGVAAGASTPDQVIKEVVGKVEELKKTKIEPEQAESNENAEETKTVSDQPAEKSAVDLYDESFKSLSEGQIVRGKVVSVDDNGALVDVGFKSEGLINASELQRRGDSDELSPGDDIDVYVLSVESGEGGLRLSKRKADEEQAWRKLEASYGDNEVIEAVVTQEVKGGLVVDVGVRGFVPASQVERGYVNDLSKYVDTPLRMKVLELDRSKNRVVLSQRVVLEEEHEKLCQETWATIYEGEIREGIVKGITDFGVFVDLGGVDGLLHISELSWGRVRHPSEIVSEGEKIEVKVLRVDKDKGKISLGRKQVLPDPWAQAEQKYIDESVVEGEVTRLAPFGAFVQLEPGVEGLVHFSEISMEHISRPEEVLAPGDIIRVKILRVKQDERRISLSIRQVDDYPDEVPGSETESSEEAQGNTSQETCQEEEKTQCCEQEACSQETCQEEEKTQCCEQEACSQEACQEEEKAQCCEQETCSQETCQEEENPASECAEIPKEETAEEDEESKPKV